MNILHITPHMGGGVGAVMRNWISNDYSNTHDIACLDYANEKSKRWALQYKIILRDNLYPNFATLYEMFRNMDVVVIHYWDHKFLIELLAQPILLPGYLERNPRIVMWCHKNIKLQHGHLLMADAFVATSEIVFKRNGLVSGRFANSPGDSPVYLETIWSVADMTEFKRIKRIPEDGMFRVGYVGTIAPDKIHRHFIHMSREVRQHRGIDLQFWFIGNQEFKLTAQEKWEMPSHVLFLGHIENNLANYYAKMDVFGYPLSPDHYGTCEQVLGEAMSAGIVPVVMDNPAEKYIVQNGINGLVAFSGSDYASKIELLMRNPQIRKRMSDAARITAAELYDTTRMVREWNKLFKEIKER